MIAYNCDIYLHLHFMIIIAETDYCEVEYLVQRNKETYQIRWSLTFFLE